MKAILQGDPNAKRTIKHGLEGKVEEFLPHPQG